MNRKLEKLALEDGLTGLANRRRFEHALKSEFKRAQRASKPLALVMIDADYFKRYNDLYGHPAGDACLRTIGAMAQDCYRRPGDLAAPYGGEEIAVLLPDTDLAGAVAIAEKIRSRVLKLAMEHHGNPAGVITVSAGVHAMVPQAGQGPLVLLHTADKALYAAKSGGRNRVCAGRRTGLSCAAGRVPNWLAAVRPDVPTEQSGRIPAACMKRAISTNSPCNAADGRSSRAAKPC